MPDLLPAERVVHTQLSATLMLIPATHDVRDFLPGTCIAKGWRCSALLIRGVGTLGVSRRLLSGCDKIHHTSITHVACTCIFAFMLQGDPHCRPAWCPLCMSCWQTLLGHVVGKYLKCELSFMIRRACSSIVMDRFRMEPRTPKNLSTTSFPTQSEGPVFALRGMRFWARAPPKKGAKMDPLFPSLY